MVEYPLMCEGMVLTSCLHGGPISLAEVAEAEVMPSWLERESRLPAGSVARVLNALCREYGSCGVMAVDGDAVIGKVRFAPDALPGGVPECVQQHGEAFVAFDPSSLTPAEELRPKSLRLWCLQVVADDRYRKKGIATAMLERTISWARAEGWAQITSRATLAIPPLLDWTGLLSVDAYMHLGFAVTNSEVRPELLEGVRNMRAGAHGEQVGEQWAGFTHLADEEAAALHSLTLDL